MIPELPVPITREAPPPVLDTPEAPAVQAALPAATAEQIQASDHLFSQTEHRAVADLVGVWTSMVLLYHLAEDSRPAPGEAEEEEARRAGNRRPAHG